MGSAPIRSSDSEDASAAGPPCWARMVPERSGRILVAVAHCAGHERGFSPCTGPKLLGDATDVLVKGLSRPRPGSTSTHLRSASCCCVLALSTWLGACPQLLAAYIMAGVVQRTMSGCAPTWRRRSTGCPSATSTSTPRGDLMSRVTNDIDNIAQSLQLTSSQALNAVLTLIGVTIDDVLDLAAPGRVRADPDPLVDGDHAFGAASIPGALHRPMDDHRDPQRAGGGGVHRARGVEGLRPSGRGRGALRPRPTTSCSRLASAPSSWPGSSCRG